jgi:hypothetical protein
MLLFVAPDLSLGLLLVAALFLLAVGCTSYDETAATVTGR